ncbi:hypothetical protein LCGC14_0459230 [marine sediment metagenome]|uniref:Uncharacterized protein n=1 Tax=marine sediment metagenome TaxID=412755 RepID=A0A0F9SKU4_9ZZZZ
MDIIIQRGKKVLIDELPEYSIAIDGFVQGPMVDTDNHRYSFDHHSGCLRYCTTASCTQAWTAVLLGLEPVRYTIYINDVDIDVCMAIWCLKNPDRSSEPQVKKLVEAIGLGDMHAGALHLNGMNKTVEWVSAPQTDSIRNGDYEKLSDSGLNTIMESILHRITQYVNGDASGDISDQEMHGNFTIIKNDENGWALAESQDPHVYTALYKAGIDRVVVSRPQDDGSNALSIAKRSDFIDHFPLPKFFAALNKIEPGWGGSTMVGGAPRNEDGSRTRLSLDEIGEVLNCVIEGRAVTVKKIRKSRPPAKKKVIKKVTKKE